MGTPPRRTRSHWTRPVWAVNPSRAGGGSGDGVKLAEVPPIRNCTHKPAEFWQSSLQQKRQPLPGGVEAIAGVALKLLADGPSAPV